MKYFLLLALVSSSASAFEIGDWQCKAEGFDQLGRRWEFGSGRHIVIWEAERAALRACANHGYAECRVFYCAENP